ncbi:AMP-dependent synthetase/ligase [Grosmannia clavigera kw1407]|uniref:AMP-dependent synthetase/ligase n=1 Tax=Grosmannia clavigera (strain kw1407 / UAMH 11150) TaxID=655863 RepID=F0XG76_GROCL|nr:AMP-dependent synthetase/ligase [Grosmannia clavigera kw1407]EFX02672.1 AMP-dependent synthetase/ligase [Grosmannia clavigera kw1407]
MGFDNLMWHLDEGVTDLFGQWNVYSSVLATLLIGIVSVFLYVRRDPDTHPLLLARQAQGSPVRQEGESPVYRSRSSPHSVPLQSGLDVRDPGVSKWARGRDGDLRDIWRQAIAGGSTNKNSRGRVLAVYGTETVQETSLDDMTRQISLIGQHMLDQGGNRVAIYLPNSVELLAGLFACSFYNMTAILLPFDQTDEALVSMLRRSAADTVITAPGCFPFANVAKSYPALRQLIWVVDEGSKHLDWNEVPEGVGGRVNVSTWQDVVGDAAPSAGLSLPPLEEQSAARDISIFWEHEKDSMTTTTTTTTKTTTLPSDMVRFTSANLCAAVAAQLSALPGTQRLGPSDLLLVADSLTHTHTLVLVLAALHAGASVALSSSAPAALDLTAATRGIAPTVVVAGPAALLRTHADTVARLAAVPLASLLLRWETRSLSDGGVFSEVVSLASRLLDRARPAIGTAPGKLRLVYTAERAAAGTPPLSSTVLSDLRVFTGARVLYGLAAAKVAGVAAQTAFYDYRVVAGGPYAPFGPPLTSTEYLLKDTDTCKVANHKLQGEIVIRGPSVANNEAGLGVIGVIRDDNTLAYA